MLILQDEAIETKAGRILPTSYISNSNCGFVYEFREYLEQTTAPGVLVSSGIEPYIYDFATIVSLGLNVTCTVSAEETHRLTTGKQGAKFGFLASSFIPRVFDRQIIIANTEISQFVDFVKNLIDLERKYFLRAMRAIRTYVVALHRLSDDLELSYTLLVASIESLAQSEDEIELEWSEYDAAKRSKMDRALEGADTDTCRRVREAVLEIEKPGAARKFREFCKANLQPTFFRGEADGVESPLSKPDLEQLLREAY